MLKKKSFVFCVGMLWKTDVQTKSVVNRVRVQCTVHTTVTDVSERNGAVRHFSPSATPLLPSGVAQLVEHGTQGPLDFMTRVRTPSGAQENLVHCSESKNIVLTRCRCAQPPPPPPPPPPPVCIRMHKNDHVQTLKIL